MKAFGPIDARSAQQLATCEAASGEPAPPSVLCADHHPGYSMPIGGVLALTDHMIPAGVGFDIACGNCAVRTDVLASDVDTRRVSQRWHSIGAAGSLQIDEERVLAALHELAREAGDSVIGWIPGSGFEGRPDLLHAGAQLLLSGDMGIGSVRPKLTNDRTDLVRVKPVEHDAESLGIDRHLEISGTAYVC